MAIPKVNLVDYPPSLRKGVERRLPRHPKFKDLTGKRFENCRVVGFVGYIGNDSAWLCRWRCGNPFVVRAGDLTCHPCRTCHCAYGILSPAAKQLRGVYHTMKSNCYNPRASGYERYGGQGIKVCKRWLASIEKFAADMGPRPSPTHVVVLRNKRGNYTPTNCYWGTRADALRSRRRGALREITHDGRTLSLASWAKVVGISREAMRTRVNRCRDNDLDVTLAITEPIRDWRPGKPSNR